MRITKKMLRTAKGRIRDRIKELCLMDAVHLDAEFHRCFPNFTLGGIQDHKDRLWFLISDVLDIALPDHWIQ